MHQTVETYTLNLYMAGDIHQARQVCREYCMEVGLCVTVTPTTYIYTGGEEAGFIVGFINYPRFPASSGELWDTAMSLAKQLRNRLCQHSFTIVGPDNSEWHTEREQ